MVVVGGLACTTSTSTCTKENRRQSSIVISNFFQSSSILHTRLWKESLLYDFQVIDSFNLQPLYVKVGWSVFTNSKSVHSFFPLLWFSSLNGQFGKGPFFQIWKAPPKTQNSKKRKSQIHQTPPTSKPRDLPNQKKTVMGPNNSNKITQISQKKTYLDLKTTKKY